MNDRLQWIGTESEKRCYTESGKLVGNVEYDRSYGLYKSIIEGKTRKHDSLYSAMRNVEVTSPGTKPCHSPYCECEAGRCTYPGFYDARGEDYAE